MDCDAGKNLRHLKYVELQFQIQKLVLGEKVAGEKVAGYKSNNKAQIVAAV